MSVNRFFADVKEEYFEERVVSSLEQEVSSLSARKSRLFSEVLSYLG